MTIITDENGWSVSYDPEEEQFTKETKLKINSLVSQLTELILTDDEEDV